jgi:hypothetical protein
MNNVENASENTQGKFSPAQLIEKAIMSGAGIDVIDRLLAEVERVSKTLAIRAFNTAIAEFKKNPPEILKNVEVSYGSGRAAYKHEDLAEVMAVVDPALAQHGLWARWKVDSNDKMVTVICLVGHADGYSEEASRLSAPLDAFGSKNHIQAIGSAVSYLQSYTLKLALGLAAAKDDDGIKSGNPLNRTITDAQPNPIETHERGRRP